MLRFAEGILFFLMFVCICSAKDKIAVFPFSRTIARDGNMTYFAETEMISLLVNQRRFDVVERAQLERILSEQSLGQTGVIDISQAVEVGKISGVKYAVLGTVTNVNFNVTKTYVKDFQGNSSPVDVVDALLAMDIRIVDIESATVIFSETYTKKPNGGFMGLGGNLSTDPETQLSSMVKDLYANEISKKMLRAFPIEGYIVSIKNNTAIIDIGSSSGVKDGMKFDVIHREEKQSPTNKIIRIDYKIGKIRAKEISEESSICKISGLGDQIKEGMIVKMQK